MYGWCILQLGVNLKKYTVELELSLFNWAFAFRRREDRGMFVLHVGPVYFSIWDNERAKEWLSSRISEVIIDNDIVK